MLSYFKVHFGYFLFVPVKLNEIPRDISGYRTALKYRIFNTKI